MLIFLAEVKVQKYLVAPVIVLAQEVLRHSQN